MKKLVLIVSTAVVAAGAAAAPPPVPSSSYIVPNDGYLVLPNPGVNAFSSLDRLCPPGSYVGQRKDGHNDCENDDGEVVPPTSAQQALDLKYGHGRTAIVGYSPMGNARTVVYFRLVQTAN